MSYQGEGMGTRARRFVADTFGFRGRSNVTAWLVAGVAAYYLFYLPEQQRVVEIQIAREAAKKRSIEMGIEDIDRARPLADPQDTGLIKGRGAVVKAAQQQQQQQGVGPEAAAAGGQQQSKS